MEFRFHPESHVYTLDNRTVPSVTQILAGVYGRQWNASDWYMERGRAVHACCAMVGRNLEFEYDERIAGQVQACRKWYKDFKPRVVHIETPFVSKEFRFAGTPDLETSSPIGPARMIIDWKASMSKMDALQLAGYGILTGAKKGMVVELHDDGTYQCSKVIDLTLWKHKFLATLTVFNVRQELNIKDKGETV